MVNQTDNFVILEQFERVFEFLHLELSFKDHQIEIIVYKTRTHAAKSFAWQAFGKFIRIRHLNDPIESKSGQDKVKQIDCNF